MSANDPRGGVPSAGFRPWRLRRHTSAVTSVGAALVVTLVLGALATAVGTPSGAVDPPTAAPIVREAIRQCEAGLPIANRVDPARGY